MSDQFKSIRSGLESPAEKIFDITPNDSTDLATKTRALNVAVSGTVRVTTTRNTTAAVYIAAGVAFPIRAKRVHASGTTATGIVGLA